jgi:hypothetical protein
MTAIDFPNTPEVNDEFTVGNITYVWDGDVWNSVGTPVAGPAGADGADGADGVGLANVDGGTPSTNYTGIAPLDAGGV